jgi:hypothetical protein
MIEWLRDHGYDPDKVFGQDYGKLDEATQEEYTDIPSISA